MSGTTISAAIGTAISAAIMDTRCTVRSTICWTFGTTISAAVGTTVCTAVVSTWNSRRATVCGAFGTTISTAVGTTVSTAVVSTWNARRTTVCGAFLLVWILLWIRHASSRESNGVCGPRGRRPLSTGAIVSRTARDHHIHMAQLWEQLWRN